MAPAAAPSESALGYQALITDLLPSPLNPRQHFEDLDDLASNIRLHGVLVPLLVRRGPKGSRADKLEIVDGERRFRAAKLAGNVEQLPVVERELADDQVLEIQLLSAIQRQALTPLEEARGYRALIDSNKAKYSAAYIADRIGRTERYVWDRMKLLDLIPEAQGVLDRDQILVSHAEILAKLKPEDQRRALGIDEDDTEYFDVPEGGLWRRDVGWGLDLDDEEEAEVHFETQAERKAAEKAAAARRKANPFRNLKPVSVPELQAWVDKHVRLDVPHAATAAPLDFGPLATRVEAAQAQPGRRKKVVAITHDNFVDPDARDEKERTFGPKSWKRADGSTKTTMLWTSRGRELRDSPTCEHSVLGVIAVGRDRGQAFEVCIARDRCQVHWKAEIAEREKNAKLRAKGQGGRANQNEAATAAKRRAEEEEEERQRAIWEKVERHVEADAIAQVKAMKAMTAQHAKFLDELDFWNINHTLTTHLGKEWFKKPLTAWLVLMVANANADSFDEYIERTAKPVGLDVTRLEAIRDKHAPKPAPEKSESVPPAKKAKAGKPAKKKGGRS